MKQKMIRQRGFYTLRLWGTVGAVLFLCTVIRLRAYGRTGDGGSESRAGYTVWFVDEEDPSAWIFAPQSGEVESGTLLTIPFPERIVGRDGYIWTATEDSPKRTEVFAPGDEKFYVSYRRGERAAGLQQPDEAGRKRLEDWIRRAWEADCRLTGNDPAGEPEYGMMTEDTASNDRRLKNLAAMVRERQEDSQEWHYVYMIGKNYVPQTLICGSWPDVEYSVLREEHFAVDSVPYTVIRVGLRRRWNRETCPHRWEMSGERRQTCLQFGSRDYRCGFCGGEEGVLLPPDGHRDEDGDSLCDSCRERVFAQRKGSGITAVLKTGDISRPLTFTCMDENYRGTGKMMYLADQVLDQVVTGPCFAEGEGNRYEDSSLRKYITYGYVNQISLAEALCPLQQDDGRENSAFIFTEEEYERYRQDPAYKTVSVPYFLRTPDGAEKIRLVEPDGGVRSVRPGEEGQAGARLFILLEPPDTDTVAEQHIWKEGEIQARCVGEREYFFRCIDEDYSDTQDYHRRAALFLCDEVIGADEAAGPDSGEPGQEPENAGMLRFGENNNYKDSDVRSWLMGAADSDYLEPVSIGVTAAWAGATEAGMKEAFRTDNLRVYPIGFQLMQDHMFCLSMEEALRYRNKLWKFSGSRENNEQSQVTRHATGYYLRTPVYRTDEDGEFCYSDEIYAVDLERGNIHPVKVDSAETGIRPAFVMKQEDGG